MNILKNFIRYVTYDTQSSEESTSTPSTLKQLELAKELVKELNELRMDKVELDSNGIVYAFLNGDTSIDTIGLIAHMDTATELPGGNYTPRVIEKYDGKDIKLNDSYTLSTKEFPSLNKHVGKTLVVTDGNHLLGGDDKAGIAIIMEVLTYYANNPNVKHAPISVCFTPDEEVGRGTENFSTEKMNAKIAYTLDGGSFDEINYENFNAASAQVNIKGVSIHPGSAKDIMINAILLAIEFNDMLPKDMVPSKTEKYEGFYHLLKIDGSAEEVTMHYILRNHDEDILNSQKGKLFEAQHALSIKYPKSKIEVIVNDSYKNMGTYFKKDPSALETIVKAFNALNITPKYVPIRGGTDGASITFMGLPCPNLGTGDYNCHGRYEYVVVEEMEQMVQVLLQLLNK